MTQTAQTAPAPALLTLQLLSAAYQALLALAGKCRSHRRGVYERRDDHGSRSRKRGNRGARAVFYETQDALRHHQGQDARLMAKQGCFPCGNPMQDEAAEEFEPLVQSAQLSGLVVPVTSGRQKRLLSVEVHAGGASVICRPADPDEDRAEAREVSHFARRGQRRGQRKDAQAKVDTRWHKGQRGVSFPHQNRPIWD